MFDKNVSWLGIGQRNRPVSSEIAWHRPGVCESGIRLVYGTRREAKHTKVTPSTEEPIASCQYSCLLCDIGHLPNRLESDGRFLMMPNGLGNWVVQCTYTPCFGSRWPPMMSTKELNDRKGR